VEGRAHTQGLAGVKGAYGWDLLNHGRRLPVLFGVVAIVFLVAAQVLRRRKARLPGGFRRGGGGGGSW
jgi:hypothetical protein